MKANLLPYQAYGASHFPPCISMRAEPLSGGPSQKGGGGRNWENFGILAWWLLVGGAIHEGSIVIVYEAMKFMLIQQC